MLRGKRRITVASPYLERLKALAGGRGRAAFGVTADAVNALLIRMFAVVNCCSKSWWIAESAGIKLVAAAVSAFFVTVDRFMANKMAIRLVLSRHRDALSS